ncbi:MAG: PTS sugar transporter subunit IIA [Mycoplasmatales bacterium]
MQIDYIEINAEIRTQQQLFEHIAHIWYRLEYISDQEAFIVDLKARESEQSTGFIDGFAIPHGKGATVLRPGVLYLKLTNPLTWETMDGQAITEVFSLAIPTDNSEKVHLQNLALISRKLVNQDFRTKIKAATTVEDLQALFINI